MSFAENFKTDRERRKVELLNASNILITQEVILEGIVLKEFNRLHGLASTATHFRVTFHADIKGKVTYNTRPNGEYNLEDTAVDTTKELLSAAVMLVENSEGNFLEAWAKGISAREDYDTDTEMSVYTFEFFG